VDLKVNDEGHNEDLKGLKNSLESFNVCVLGDLCVNIVDLHIMGKHLNYWELQRTITFHRILQGGSLKGAMVLCKTCEAVNEELKCVFFYVVNLWGGDINTGLCNLFGFKFVYYKV
jgi:hypothetical protein